MTIINTVSLASRLSPFSYSLFAPSPPSLPAAPTLAELQTHASTLGKTITSNLPLPAKVTDSKAKTNPSVPPAVANTNKAWFNASPPGYEVKDPYSGGGTSKLKKGKIGWKRIQGEDKDTVKVKSGGVQPEVEDAEKRTGDEVKPTWWEWLSCRA